MDKTVRSGWRVRRRYKLARLAAVALGALVAVTASFAAYGSAAAAGVPVTSGFILQTLVLVAGAVAVPWLVVELLWRRARRRHFWEWQ
jgi:NADH:ubiquinone oxidoreductase subunit 4 (subunit M)